MKIKSKIYAEALVSSIIEKKSKDVVVRFIKLLEKNGDIKKAKEIISLAESLFLKKTGNKKIVLEVAREMEKPALVKDFGVAKGDIVEEKINPSLIAGIKVIINNERQLDFSLKNKLDKIF